MGWWASDTAELALDDVQVPVENLLGEEGAAFYGLMHNFQRERLNMSLMANATAQLALDESIKGHAVGQCFWEAAYRLSGHKAQAGGHGYLSGDQ